MPQLSSRIVSALVGDHRTFPIEHRLFNVISLLNAAANAGGALQHVLFLPGYEYLPLLQLATGLLFFLCYYLSRFRRVRRPLYWPFVLLMAGFLFVNALGNAATGGGAHYYLITGLVISVVLIGKRARERAGRRRLRHGHLRAPPRRASPTGMDRAASARRRGQAARV